MSAVFERATERTRSEPRPSLEASTVRAINNAHRLGRTEGDRAGYVRGFRFGWICGACFGAYLGVLGTLAVQSFL